MKRMATIWFSFRLLLLMVDGHVIECDDIRRFSSLPSTYLLLIVSFRSSGQRLPFHTFKV